MASAVQPLGPRPTTVSSPPARGLDASKLIVFLKAPRPGTVKTRLAAAVGAAAACSAYVRLVETLLEHLLPLPEVELRFSPDDAAGEVQPWLRSSWSLVAQGDGELGDRLERAFRNSFDQGWGRVIVIGSDCPAVTRQDIADGWSALVSHDVALGPARDGGYWLLGLRRHQPALFRGIAWSTERVLEQTLSLCAAAGLHVRLLRELADVDTEQDWLEFVRRSGSGPT